MLVKELIEKLSKMNGDMEVVVIDLDNEYDDSVKRILDVKDNYNDEDFGEKKKVYIESEVYFEINCYGEKVC